MQTAEQKNPFPQLYRVAFVVKTEGDWFCVECDRCHRILVSGDEQSLGQTVEAVLVRAVNQHLHEDGSNVVRGASEHTKR